MRARDPVPLVTLEHLRVVTAALKAIPPLTPLEQVPTIVYQNVRVYLSSNGDAHSAIVVAEFAEQLSRSMIMASGRGA